MADTDELSDKAKPRGWCGRRVSLFSWRAVLVRDKDTKPGAILRCHGGGNRPCKRRPAHAQD